MPALVDTKYEADSGRVHSLRLSPGFSTAAGTVPAGPVNDSLRPKISKSSREYGLRPRGVRLARTIGTAPDTFKKYTFLPVLSPTAFSGAGFNNGATITINGQTWKVVTKIPEDYN